MAHIYWNLIPLYVAEAGFFVAMVFGRVGPAMNSTVYWGLGILTLLTVACLGRQERRIRNLEAQLVKDSTQSN